MKKLGIAIAAFVGLLALALAAFGDRDMAAAALEEKYANENSHFLQLGSGTVAHVRDQGLPSGDPLVLVHGSNASLHTWEPWVSRLGDEFRVITLDLPGHGLTGRTLEDDYSIEGMVAFVDEVTRKLGAEHFHLAGNSMGGRLGWNYALDHSERLDRLVLIDASGFPEPEGEEESLAFRLARTPGLQYLMLFATPRALFAATLRDTVADPSLVTDEMIDRYHELQLREGSRAASLARYQLPTVYPRIAEISSITSPTLVMWGEQDQLVPVEDAQKFVDAIPDARLRVYSGVGHLPMEEAPDRSAADLGAFLRGEI